MSAAGGQVFALDAASGKVVWQRDLGAELHTSINAAGNALYVGDRDGRIHKLSVATGAVEATLDTGGTPYGTMVLAEGCLLAQWSPGTFACIDPALSAIRWRKSAEEWSSFKSLVANGAAFTGTENGRVSQFRLRDGVELWSQTVKGPIKGLAIADDGILYVGTQNGMIYALLLPKPGHHQADRRGAPAARRPGPHGVGESHGHSPHSSELTRWVGEVVACFPLGAAASPQNA